MENLTVLHAEIERFQKEILDDLKPYFLDSRVIFNEKNWYSESDHIFLRSQDNQLVISSADTLSNTEYDGNAVNFLPETSLKILQGETFEVAFSGETTGPIHLSLLLTEYSHEDMLNTHHFELNPSSSRIKLSADTCRIGITLLVTGEGLGIIEGLVVKRIKKRGTAFLNKRPLQKAPQKISDLKMACIFDEFSMSCYQEEVKLITFTPDNWFDVLEQNPPDVLFVESAWQGNHGSWQYRIAKYKTQDKIPLIDLIQWCRDAGIPTVFWNKEDPIHFDKFIDSAVMFDYIFTTDTNMIPEYQKRAGHDHVYPLAFSAEPKLHNPIQTFNHRKNKVCFAGSYYANRHPERKQDMEDVLDMALPYGLDIYDRNYEKNKQGTTHFSFPERFESHIISSLQYDEIDKAYKGYKVMLNVNSVKHSPTMFSRRVFEGLACGTPVISNASLGVKKVFKDLVITSSDKKAFRMNLEKLMSDEDFYREKALEGIREVYLNHTYKHRIKDIFAKMGIGICLEAPKISVVSVVQSAEEFERILHYFKEQTLQPKRLIVFLDQFPGSADILNQYNNEHITCYVLSYMDQYSRLSDLVKERYIAFFHPDHFYGENYLLDLSFAIEYSKAEVVGKNCYFHHDIANKGLSQTSDDNEYSYVNDLSIDASISQTEMFRGERLYKILDMIRSCQSLNPYVKKGYRLFSTDKYNFIKNGKNLDQQMVDMIEK
ncbi:spore maturation protein CgeB [Scopulibacillus darangshiensis]|uniref:Spore maturation protein CgeB n=1 Tax=Scopulibacillus darangshiensis TaxID=442528 RepID=A0A4R2P7P0_9BACL|nr:glycosyltransferase [Scopulibacillus darangshiensis]TCP30001.1 spore maturation protein CgeB [Scopulibacillus darangshiensis]